MHAHKSEWHGRMLANIHASMRPVPLLQHTWLQKQHELCQHDGLFAARPQQHMLQCAIVKRNVHLDFLLGVQPEQRALWRAH